MRSFYLVALCERFDTLIREESKVVTTEVVAKPVIPEIKPLLSTAELRKPPIQTRPKVAMGKGLQLKLASSRKPGSKS